MKNIILCDIDGTVANNDHRQHFLEGKKDWDGFFDALNKDKPIYSVINKIIEDFHSGRQIIFLTGRPERYRGTTEIWLRKYFSFELKLLMRKDNDQRGKLKIKKEIFEGNFNANDIYYILDNDADLIKMWEELSLVTFDATSI